MAKIQLYKKNPCPYCDRAINLLNSKDVEFEIIDLTDKMDELQKLKDQWGWKTVPLILIDNKLVGGYTDLKDLDEAGTLDSMIKG